MKAFVVEPYGQNGLRAADVPEPEAGDGVVLGARPRGVPAPPGPLMDAGDHSSGPPAKRARITVNPRQSEAIAAISGTSA
jgi:hypothetical protein